MIKDVLDIHTHTLASGHAYSTIRENAETAAEKGLEILGITDHAPKLPGSCTSLYFQNLKVVDRHAYPCRLLLGAELNILDDAGTVDMPEKILRQMDVCIASLHSRCMRPGSRKYNTAAYVNAMKNPYVDVIGHPDDGTYPADYEEIVKAAKENNVLIELNNSSLKPGGSRKDCRANDEVLLALCMEYGVPVIVGSDAHVDTDVGRHEMALALLDEAGFPEELVVNRKSAVLLDFLQGKRERPYI